ncbi:MAG: tryptophan synthase subunit alpha, partial [Syntrophomonadaceae bacterium]|nr:tryptophan synthase subunit alpha [Syntrophomonadaceae bacterium]
GNGKGLVTFITGGDPDLRTTSSLIVSLARNGADIVEVGVAFSDPTADGPVIQRASTRALKSGTTLAGVLDAVKQAKAIVEIPVVLMTYYNPVLQYGLGRFCHDACQSGVNGIIVPDLPYEERMPLSEEAASNQLDLIPMIAPTSSPERIKKLCKSAQGFIYGVSINGVTGVRKAIDTDLERLSHSVRQYTDLPLAIGFGVSGPSAAAQVASYCDAVIVGSAIVELIEQGRYKDLEQLVRDLKQSL